MDIISKIKIMFPNFSYSEISGLLYLIKNKKNLTNSNLIKETGIPKEELKRFKIAISDLLIQNNEDYVYFNDKGLDLLKKLDVKEFEWSILNYQNNRKNIKELDFIKQKLNIKPKREFDQWIATTETSLNKAKIINSKGQINDQKIAILGDDDFLSVSIALINNRYKNITVFDVDKDLINNLLQLKIHRSDFILYDVKNDLPTKYIGQFDVVIIDPPYTIKGVTLFLNKAVQLLTGPNKYIFLYYGNSFKSLEKFFKVQQIIEKMGLVIEDKINKFAKYDGAESIGSSSSLYILKTTNFLTTLNSFSNYNGFYTFESIKEEKFPYVDHITFKITKVSTFLLKSKSNLLKTFKEFCLIHRLKIVDTYIKEFKNNGLTITFILSNSNLIIHTWPEYNALHLDLITCSPIINKKDLLNTLVKLLGQVSIDQKIID